jgi:hypothetical protein
MYSREAFARWRMAVPHQNRELDGWGRKHPVETE